MNVPVWAADLAYRFWQAAGTREDFPRKLLGPINNAVPLAVIRQSRPTTQSVLDWLHANGVQCNLRMCKRRLRACLVARYGQGFAFVDSSDPEDEQGFSIAHELAHFLRDYLHPRRRIVESLGTEALDVLDGIRPPTSEERLHALLSSTSIGYYTHLMDRDEAEGSLSAATLDVENCADRLAYELLAPAHEVAVRLNNRNPTPATVIQLLVNEFGFPRRPAGRYAELLCPRRRRAEPFLSRLAEAL